MKLILCVDRFEMIIMVIKVHLISIMKSVEPFQ